MNFLKWITLSTLTLTQFSLNGATTSPQVPFALITVPKSGSHLMIKTLHLLTGGVAVWHTRFPSAFYLLPEKGFLYTHLCLSPELQEEYARLPEMKRVVMIRDLRDVAVSIVGQIKKGPWPGMTYEQREAFLSSTFEDQLDFVIHYDYDVEEVANIAPNSLQVSLKQVAEQAVFLRADPTVYVCRYENLVGEKGGGTDDAQIQELRRIAEFLELEVSDERLSEIAGQLYGNDFDPFGKPGFLNFGSTFNRGKQGTWRTVFGERHKQSFKETLGDALIALEYEPDNNW